MNASMVVGEDASLNASIDEHVQLVNSSKLESPSPKKITKRTRPWFESGLPLEFRGSKSPNKIIKVRNIAIIALCIQIASILAGFAFSVMRRNSFSLALNIISLIVMISGFWGVLFLSKSNTAIHGVFTSSVIGVFALYSVLEAAVLPNLSQGGSNRFSDRGVLLLFSIPYFIDLCAGLITFYLTYLLFREHDRRELERIQLEQVEPEIKMHADYDEETQLCCVCMLREKNTVIYTCGHKALCIDCAKVLKATNNAKCPICRNIIKDIIPIYS